MAGKTVATEAIGAGARARARAFALVGLLALALPMGCGRAAAAPAPVPIPESVPTLLPARITAAVANGFARLIVTLPPSVEASVRQAGSIVIISFKQPVEVSIDRLVASLPGYVAVTRRDPDGMAVRIGLARRVTVNTINAGEQLYVDLLPDRWVGLPPGLPPEAIDGLARRVREAARKARQQKEAREDEAFIVETSPASAPAGLPARTLAGPPTEEGAGRLLSDRPPPRAAAPSSLPPVAQPAPPALARPAPPPSAPAAVAVARKDKPKPARYDGKLTVAQVAHIKHKLRLTAEQEAQWKPVEAILIELAHRQAQSGAKLVLSSGASMNLYWAAGPLVMSLREDQKNEARNLARAMGLESVASQI